MLLSFPAGWNLNVPAGTFLIRVDTVMNTRPGAGGYCAILEASDQKESIIIRGGHPDTDTNHMMQIIALRLAEEIEGNRAVILTRNQPMLQKLSAVFKPYPMIRILGHSPIAVSDATRHAHVMAERTVHIRKSHYEKMLYARFEPNKEEFSENQDSASMHAALQHLVKNVGFKDLKSDAVRIAAQATIDAAETETLMFQKEVVRRQTSNDIPKPTKMKEI